MKFLAVILVSLMTATAKGSTEEEGSQQPPAPVIAEGDSLMTQVISMQHLLDTEEGDSEVAEEEPQVTQVLTIEHVLSKSTTTVMHTNVVYPTCTTTVSGITACAGPKSRLAGVSNLYEPSAPYQYVTSTRSPEGVTTPEENPSSTYQLAEVVMPSCDCLVASQRRHPRLLSDNFITIRSTITVTDFSVTFSTDTSTTVSITYNGCIPNDAPSTVVCEG